MAELRLANPSTEAKASSIGIVNSCSVAKTVSRGTCPRTITTGNVISGKREYLRELKAQIPNIAITTQNKIVILRYRIAKREIFNPLLLITF